MNQLINKFSLRLRVHSRGRRRQFGSGCRRSVQGDIEMERIEQRQRVRYSPSCPVSSSPILCPSRCTIQCLYLRTFCIIYSGFLFFIRVFHNFGIQFRGLHGVIGGRVRGVDQVERGAHHRQSVDGALHAQHSRSCETRNFRISKTSIDRKF